MRGHAFDGASELVDFDEFLPLLVCLGDNPFAHVVVRDLIFLAEGIHQLAATDAKGCFQRRGAIIQAGMNYLVRT